MKTSFFALSVFFILPLSLPGLEQAPTQNLHPPDAVPKGLSASDWSSIRQQYEKHRHAAVAAEGGYQARNPGQQWLTKFDGRGFSTQPETGGWQWGLELRSYGFAGHKHVIGERTKIEPNEEHITYGWDATVQEWFVNNTRGLEHGFTVAQRPDGKIDKTGFLQLDLAVRGDLRPDISSGGDVVHFVNSNGATVINYTALKVWDADGKRLPAKFSSVTAGFRITIDERGARYPLTIDPIAQQAYLKASNTEPGNNQFRFGWSVAVSSETAFTVAIGVPFEDSNATGVNGNESDITAADSGAVYVFVRNGTTWSQEAYIKASNTGAGDQFGYSVALSGDTLVVGAHLEDSNATGINGNQADNSALESGAAYVFVRSAGVWSQQAYIKASNTGEDDEFGYSVAVSGNTVAIGAIGEASNANGVNGDQNNNSFANAGAAYVFVRSGTTWSQQAYLKASNTGAGDFFGISVAAAAETVLVGAVGEDSNATGINGNQGDNTATDAGAAYVFARSGAVWSQQAYLKASNTDANDHFGFSVSISGDTAVIGAPLEDSNATGTSGNQADNSATDAGAVYVFFRTGTIWNQQAYLKASNTGANDQFGYSVAVSLDTVLVGAIGEDSNATGINGNQNDNSIAASGAGYVFVRAGTAWSQQAYLKASNTGANDNFGYAVAISLDLAVIGAPFEDSNAKGIDGDQTNNSDPDSGAAYTFTRNGTSWVQQAYLKDSNSGTIDGFGTSVAVSGDTIVVGAPEEASSATGVNGNQADNSAPASGAAYVFVRNGTTWTQQAYLKASNTGKFDGFANSVAISGDTIVIGAYGEDSNATGVNGNQTNESDESAGAAYVFVRSGTSWSQQAYLKASNTATFALFGLAVAISGNTIVVGAQFESSTLSNSGAAYVFVRNGTSWSQQAFIKASNPDVGDSFGGSVAAAGDTIVVGAYPEASNATGVNGNQADNSAPYAGAAYIFFRNGTTWTQQAYLKASNTDAGDQFGQTVAVSGDSVIIGATGESSNAVGVNGDQTNNAAPYSGAAYVFVRSGTTWTQQAYLKASNAETNDTFGTRVAISNNVAVVGANAESSNATGVNGNQSDNSALASGAAYVFSRSGTTWSQLAYLKASNTDIYDQFGSAVAVAGDTVVVGAPYEDSNATGVNGDQANNSSLDSGAAYIFPLTTAVSKKFHDTVPFNLDLPSGGTPAIEPRRNTGTDTTGLNVGHDHQVVVTFANTVTALSGVSVTNSNNGATATFSMSGNLVTVDLHQVLPADRLTINLTGVSDGTNTTNVSIPMNVLLADVNGSGRVDSGDVSLVRQQTLQPITLSNFREDINVSNRIDSGDVSIARQQTLTSLP